MLKQFQYILAFWRIWDSASSSCVENDSSWPTDKGIK